MNHVKIGRSPDREVPLDLEARAIELLNIIEKARGLGVKIFEMTTYFGAFEVKIITTSKEVFLELGGIGDEGQRSLAGLVYNRAGMDGRLLLTSHHHGPCSGFLCVMREVEDNPKKLVLDISRANANT